MGPTYSMDPIKKWQQNSGPSKGVSQNLQRMNGRFKTTSGHFFATTKLVEILIGSNVMTQIANISILFFFAICKKT